MSSGFPRWLGGNAPLASGTKIEIVNGKKITYKTTSFGKLIDDALANPPVSVSDKALAVGTIATKPAASAQWYLL